MRQIVLDTESTGLDPDEGHRLIEIGAVELMDRRLSGRHFHQLLQPDRAIDAGAFEVHGITEAKLEDKPRFGEVADELLRFIEGAELVIHNAEFDIAFLDHELGLLGDSRAHRRIADACSVLDTLALARKLHPGQRNNLDALCKRYRVDNSRRESPQCVAGRGVAGRSLPRDDRRPGGAEPRGRGIAGADSGRVERESAPSRSARHSSFRRGARSTPPPAARNR